MAEIAGMANPVPGQNRVVFDLSVLKAGYFHRVQCEQAHLAAAAGKTEAGIEVNYGCQVEDIVDKGRLGNHAYELWGTL